MGLEQKPKVFISTSCPTRADLGTQLALLGQMSLEAFWGVLVLRILGVLDTFDPRFLTALGAILESFQGYFIIFFHLRLYLNDYNFVYL